MTRPKRSPRIEHLHWGGLETEVGDFRDAKLWPGGGRDWDWTETGTHHSPGVQTADLHELIENGSEVVIIGCGQNERLEVTKAIRDWLEGQDTDLEVHESSVAVDRYNTLRAEGVAVGALIHSTC